MMHQPRIRSRRLLDEQDRTARQPMSDQDAPGRIPVEVLEMQMAQFGMHSRFNREGVNVLASRQVEARQKTLMEMTLTDMAKETGMPRATLRQYFGEWQGTRRDFLDAMRKRASELSFSDYIRSRGMPVKVVFRRLALRGLATTRENIDAVVDKWTPGKFAGKAFTVRRYALEHGVNYSTLYRWVKESGLPATRETCDTVMQRHQHRKRRAA